MDYWTNGLTDEQTSVSLAFRGSDVNKATTLKAKTSKAKATNLKAKAKPPRPQSSC